MDSMTLAEAIAVIDKVWLIEYEDNHITSDPVVNRQISKMVLKWQTDLWKLQDWYYERTNYEKLLLPDIQG